MRETFEMKKTAYLAAAFFGLAALGQAGAHAGVVNAGFETGDLTGWTVTYAPLDFYPPWYIQTAHVYEAPWAFAGDDYALLTPAMCEGCWITLSQTFFMSQGETINGAVQFNPFYAWEYRDRALVTINGVTLYSAMDGVIATASLNKWTPYAFTAPSDDSYTLTAYIRHGFSSGESSLMLDAIELEHSASAVPEPSTWAMLLIGFAGLGYAGYRRARLAV
jgi:PEP-CTERM motif